MTNAQRTDYASAAIVGKPINGLWSYKYAGLNEEGRAHVSYTHLDVYKRQEVYRSSVLFNFNE